MSAEAAHNAAAVPAEEPVTLGLTAGNAWLVAGAFFSLLLFYVVGIDQGAVTVFGKIAPVHEFLHDARHFLGYPCH